MAGAPVPPGVQTRSSATTAGNGESATTVELDGETGGLSLALAADPAGPVLHQADVLLRP